MSPETTHTAAPAASGSAGGGGRLSRLFGSRGPDRATVEAQARAELERLLVPAATAPVPTGSAPRDLDRSDPEPHEQVGQAMAPAEVAAPPPPPAEPAESERQWISEEELSTFPGMFGRRPAPLPKSHFHELHLE